MQDSYDPIAKAHWEDLSQVSIIVCKKINAGSLTIKPLGVTLSVFDEVPQFNLAVLSNCDSTVLLLSQGKPVDFAWMKVHYLRYF